jgi:molybdopterin-guanine dinucleotide biosynthesis protein A
MHAAGFVLVGGRSSRMGRDKAHLTVGSRLMVELVADTVAEVAGNVALVGNPKGFEDLPYECLPDLRTGLGPLAGLEAALASGRAEFNVVAGCDMPGIKAGDLKHLLSVCEQTHSLCTLANDASGRKHPLFAVYRRDCLPFVCEALDAGRLRLLDLVEDLKAVECSIDSVLTNLNTPEQWAAWQAARLV